MKKTLIYMVAALGVIGSTMHANAQKFVLKAYDNIGIGKAMSITESQPGQTSETKNNAFGLDFGYTFWRKGINSLEVNLGLGYSYTSVNMRLDNLSYNYAAPATADVDGNAYTRYYELSDFKQHLHLGYINIPIYLEYQVKPLKWLGIHAEAGVDLGFHCAGYAVKTRGSAYSYGVFPEYDNLVINAPYIDDFGQRDIRESMQGKAGAKVFMPALLCGAGLEFYATKSISFVVGVRYNTAFKQCCDGKYTVNSVADYTATTAPVTYTVAEGTTVKSLTDYTTKSRLSPLSVRVGINYRF